MKSHVVCPSRKALVGAMVVAMVTVIAPPSNGAEIKKDTSPAAKEGTSSAEEEMDALVRQGPGVYRIKKDSKGRVQRLIIVGQARISTVLGSTKGNEIARKKAAQSTRAEFVKWLGEKVEVHESAENETTLFLTGAEEAGKDALSEAGKAVEKSSDLYKSVAEGLVRGLTLLHANVNAEERTCTLVYGWSLASARAAKHVATNDPSIEDRTLATRSKGPSEDKGSSDKKKIRSKKTTSKEAEDFLK